MAFQSHKNTYKIINMMIQFFIETFVGMAIGYFMGKTLDQWLLDEKQVFVYIFIVFGIFGAFRNLVKRALKMTGGDTNEKKDDDH